MLGDWVELRWRNSPIAQGFPTFYVASEPEPASRDREKASNLTWGLLIPITSLCLTPAWSFQLTPLWSLCPPYPLSLPSFPVSFPLTASPCLQSFPFDQSAGIESLEERWGQTWGRKERIPKSPQHQEQYRQSWSQIYLFRASILWNHTLSFWLMIGNA